MSSILIGVGLIILMFFNAIQTSLSLPSFVGYTDEAVSILLFICWILVIIRDKKIVLKREISYCYNYLLIIIVVGLIANLLFEYAYSVGAIVRDIVGFLKFPLVFLICKQLGIDDLLYYAVKKVVIPFLKILIPIIFIAGIVSIFVPIGLSQMTDFRGGIYPYQFLFSHPTSLVICVCEMLALMITDNRSDHPSIFEIMLFVIAILTMRTKSIVWIAGYIYIRYVGSWMRRYRLLYWGGIVGVLGAFSFSKLQLVASYSTSERETLWIGSLEIARMKFPIGSGFATYASSLSGKFRSSVYDLIHLSGVFDASGIANAAIGDTGYPYYIGQFGVIGTIVFGMLLWKIYKISLAEGNKYSIISIFLYLLLALTAENTLLNHGLVIALLLAAVSVSKKEKIILDSDNA